MASLSLSDFVIYRIFFGETVRHNKHNIAKAWSDFK